MEKLTIEEKIEISFPMVATQLLAIMAQKMFFQCIILKSRVQYNNDKICFRCSRKKPKPKTKNIKLCPN